MIDVQTHRNPFINIINNNVSKSNDDKESGNVDNPCENKRQRCMKSCENSIFCESECNMQFNMCDTEQRIKPNMSFSSGSFRKEERSSSTSGSFKVGIKPVVPVKPIQFM